MINAIKKNALVLVLCASLIFALPMVSAADTDEETRVSITIVYSGAIGGLFFFIAFSIRGFAPNPNQELFANQALVNYGPNGWRVGLPLLKAVKLQNEDNPQPFLEFLHLKF